jgi:hypothetical protein
VPVIWLASARNVEILAQDHAELVPTVTWLITHLRVLVPKDSQEIRSLTASRNHHHVRRWSYLFVKIQTRYITALKPVQDDPCNPSPCGPNAQCNNGVCTCLPEYQGDPYRGCRPECVLSSDCPRDKACIRNKCVDPCPGTCGQNAECSVINHIPICSCLPGYTGSAFVVCRLVESKIHKQSCDFWHKIHFFRTCDKTSLQSFTLWP